MSDQISKILPRSDWENVVIEENNEELVEIVETSRLKRSAFGKKYQPQYLVRKTLAEKLYKASEFLPEGTNLVVIEGYRSLKTQENMWNEEFENLKKQNPTWSDEDVERQVRVVIAKPNPLANHNCGGAVDVTLAFEDGNPLDMGSPYPNKGYDLETQKKYPMFTNGLTDNQIKNRALLRNTMISVGLVYYPGEWWHYCYGDRMWAVYTRQEKCFYGPISF